MNQDSKNQLPLSKWCNVGLAAVAISSPSTAISNLGPMRRNADTSTTVFVRGKTESAASWKADWHLGEEQTRHSTGGRSSDESWTTQDLPISEMAKQALGTHGVNRLQRFATLEDGWDFGHGRALQESSLRTLNRFTQVFSYLSDRNPSVFLSNDGMIELQWEDDNNETIELTFLSDGIDFFAESTDTESFFHFEEFFDLANILNG